MFDIHNLRNTEIVLATHNPGKVVEIQSLLDPYDVSVLSAGDLGLPEPVEDSGTFEGNALIKSRSATLASGKIALADDSGLSVDALNGDPGVDSALWAGPNKNFIPAMERVLSQLGNNPNRTARFVCVLAISTPDGQDMTFRGEIVGEIVPMQGDKGFGFDPIFKPQGYDVTFAEMDRFEKQKMSHRGRAFEHFIKHCFSKS